MVHGGDAREHTGCGQEMKEITLVMKTPEDVLQSQGVTPENIDGLCGTILFFPN